MKQHKKNIILIISIIMLGCCTAFSEPQQPQQLQQPQQGVQTQQEAKEATPQPITQSQDTTTNSEETTTNLAQTDIPETIPEKNAENLKKIKNSVTESKIFMVVLMGCIAGLLLLFIFGCYKLYRRITGKNYIIDAPPKETLATPKDFKSAINLFLGKTDD